MMAGTAGFDPDHRWRELLEERHHLVTPELFAQNRDTGVIYPMKLKNVLRRIHSNSANLVHGRSPLFEINTRPHSGTLDAAAGRPHQQNPLFLGYTGARKPPACKGRILVGTVIVWGRRPGWGGGLRPGLAPPSQ